MSTLREINQRQTEQTLARARRIVPNKFKSKEDQESAYNYIQRRMDGRTPGPKPKIRSRVAQRLLDLDSQAEADRLAHLMEWNNNE